MDGFNYFLVLLIISLMDISGAENSNALLYYADGRAGIDYQQQQQQQFRQSDNLENLITTAPDYLNPNNQISFAAPVGAQHPNQKPQPEPQPPPYRQYHEHSVYINGGMSRSYVHYQRTFY